MFGLKYIHFTIFYILFISIISHIPNDNLPESGNSFPNQDKIFHLVEFFILGLLIQFSFYEDKYFNQKAVTFMTIIIGFTIACLDELHQNFIQGRICSIDDLMFDFFGIILSFFNHKTSF